MFRFVFLCALALVLTSCGDDGDCGPNPCGACLPGCSPSDTCTSSGWSCDCICDGVDSGIDGGMDSSADTGTPDTATPDGSADTSVDAPVDTGAPDTMNPVGCPPDGMGMCDPMGLECRYGDRVCSCQPPCSGVDPGPDPPYNWACAVRPLACPASTPMNGAACRMPGLACAWGTCGGSTATCTAGMWVVMITPPPP